MEAKGVYRDAVRSSHSHFVKAMGLRWLSLMWLVPIPWAGRVWALLTLGQIELQPPESAAHPGGCAVTTSLPTSPIPIRARRDEGSCPLHISETVHTIVHSASLLFPPCVDVKLYKVQLSDPEYLHYMDSQVHLPDLYSGGRQAGHDEPLVVIWSIVPVYLACLTPISRCTKFS